MDASKSLVASMAVVTICFRHFAHVFFQDPVPSVGAIQCSRDFASASSVGVKVPCLSAIAMSSSSPLIVSIFLISDLMSPSRCLSARSFIATISSVGCALMIGVVPTCAVKFWAGGVPHAGVLGLCWDFSSRNRVLTELSGVTGSASLGVPDLCS